MRGSSPRSGYRLISLREDLPASCRVLPQSPFKRAREEVSGSIDRAPQAPKPQERKQRL